MAHVGQGPAVVSSTVWQFQQTLPLLHTDTIITQGVTEPSHLATNDKVVMRQKQRTKKSWQLLGIKPQSLYLQLKVSKHICILPLLEEETFDTMRQFKGKWRAFSRQKLNPCDPLAWATSALDVQAMHDHQATTIPHNPLLVVTHWATNHSVRAIQTRRKIRNTSPAAELMLVRDGCCGIALAAQHRAIPAAARFSHSQLRQDDAPVWTTNS